MRAFKRLSDSEPDSKLVLAGGGHREDKIVSLIRELELSDRCLFVGRVPAEQMQDYYSACNAMVYPRISNRLTEMVTPLKPLEAMAQRIPVIASDIGGHRELIEDGHTGRLYRVGDEQRLVDVMRQAMADRDATDRMVENGRAFVENERQWEHSADRYLPVYDRVLRQ